MLNIRLYFDDNNSWNNKEANFPHLRSLAKTLMWLYSDEADGPREQYYNIDGVIKLYQLVNVILLLVSHARSELGEATVKEFIHDMKRGKGNGWKTHDNDISEFTNKKGERGMSIMWATYELVMSILWGCYIYCHVLTRLGLEEQEWQHASNVFYKILQYESCLKASAFQNHWLVKHTDEMVNNMLSDIESRKEKKSKKAPSTSQSCSAVQEIKQLKVTIEQKNTHINKLKQENEELKGQIDMVRNREKGISLGINQAQTALFGLSLANILGFNYTNKKKELAPVLHKIFGWGEAKIAAYLSTPCDNDERDCLAALFKDLSPELYATIMNRGELPPEVTPYKEKVTHRKG